MFETAPDLSNIAVSKQILLQIPEQVARQYLVFPFGQDGNILKIAMVDPENQEIIELIEAKTGKLIRPYKIDPNSLTKLLEQYSAIVELAQKVIQQNPQQLAQSTPAIAIVESILRQAAKDLASDVHIEATTEGTIVRFRVDGMLRTMITLPKSLHPAIISRIKILSNMKIDVTRTPQDGRFQINVDTAIVDLRISTYPTVEGEKVVMRLLDKSKGLITLEQLGVAGRQFSAIEAAIHKPHGMILVTGPTGSGKTTTLYAVLQRLHKPDVNIITIEDPVEYRIAGVNQGQIHPEIGFTFAVALRSILRQDPNIVMIGEMRDLESAELAVQAALTGHIVLSTLHTNDSVGAIPRLLDLGIPPFLINASLNIVVAQRLARKVCDHCKKPLAQLLPADGKAVEDIIGSLPAQEKAQVSAKAPTFYQAVGCPKCKGKGYKGRIGIFEVLDISEGVKPLIVKEVQAQAIAQKAKEEGMLTLIQDGLLRALNGVTTLEEIWRISRD